ncbi:hypothetical protein [Saccharicrinis aurantiacus]|uniref:hypothetical protein n=1 Tax=Saccharicrinis aurantiacus TaxID=1849719 RepID=UPI0008391C3E|nr:hypothetical protein [Saccharicrinis aurantiacus]
MRKEYILLIILTLPFSANSQNCDLEEYNYPYNQSDTLIIENGFEKVEADLLIKNMVRYRESGLFLHSYSKYQDKELLCLIMDEGESVSLMLYVIKSCKVLDSKALYSISEWEHGIRKGKAYVNQNRIVCSLYLASRDWGDYTKWKYGTEHAEYLINAEGKIINNKR